MAPIKKWGHQMRSVWSLDGPGLLPYFFCGKPLCLFGSSASIGLPGKVQLELPFWSFWFCLILLRVPRLWHCTQHLHQAWVLLLRELSGSMSVSSNFCVPVLCTSHCHSWLMMRHVNQTLVSLCVPVNGKWIWLHWKYIFPPPYVGSTSTKLQY